MVGGQWRGVVRNRSIPLRGVKNLLARIFANGEQGGAYDYSDLTDEKLAWRVNQLIQSEDLTAPNYFKADTTVTRNTTTTPPAGVVGLSTVRFTAVGGYVGQLINRDVVPGMKASISAIVNSTTRLLIFGGATPAGTDTYTAEDIGGGWYRQKSTRTFTVTAKQGAIQWLIAQTAIGAPINTDFVTSAAQLEMNGVVSAYQRITDVSTEFLTAFPTHSLFQDNVGNLATFALEQPIGMVLDKRFGDKRSDEVCGDPGFDTPAAWTTGGVSDNQWVVSGGKATISAPASSGNRWLANNRQLTVGKWYEIYVDVTVVAGAIVPDVSATPVLVNSSGRKHWILLASTTTLQMLANAAFVGSIDNFSFRELPGNHRTQATTTDRPIVSGLYNKLRSTADMSVSPWVKRGAVTLASVTGPDGTPGTTLTALGVAATDDIYQILNNGSYPNSIPITPRLTVKKVSTSGTLQVSNAFNAANGTWNINLALLGTDWETITASHPAVTVVNAWTSTTNGAGGVLYSSVGGSINVSVWGHSQLPGNDAMRYQRVNTATDYDAVGFPKGARFNGSNSWMSATLPLAGNDKLGFAASLRKDSDAATAMLFELSASTSANDGTYGIRAPQGASGTYGFALRGTGAAANSDASRVTNANYPAPHTAVLSCAFDLAQPDVTTQIAPQVNGVTPTLTTGGLTAAGAGNLATAVEYVGRRGGVSLPFGGMLYRDVRRVGAPSDMLGLLKQWVNEPARVTLQ